MNPLSFIALIFAALCVVAFVSGILTGLFGWQWMLVIVGCWLGLSILCASTIGPLVRGLLQGTRR